MTTHRHLRETLEALPAPHRERVRALLNDRDGLEGLVMRQTEALARVAALGNDCAAKVHEVNLHFGSHADKERIEL